MNKIASCIDQHRIEQSLGIDELGFAASTFRFAGPAGRFSAVGDLEGHRVATSYDGLVGAYLRDAGVSVTLVRLDGAVESAVRLGVADAVADVVETGSTLRKQGLDIFGPVILQSQAVLIGAPTDARDGDGHPGLGTLHRRLQGVMVARQYVLIDYDLPSHLIEQAVALRPGV